MAAPPLLAAIFSGFLLMLLPVWAEQPPVSVLFGPVCTKADLISSIAACAVDHPPNASVWFAPDYVYASPGSPKSNAAVVAKASAGSEPIDFVLLQDLRIGSSFLLPSMCAPLPVPRKFVANQVRMDLAYIARALPLWSNQIAYIRSFCGSEGGKFCAFTVQDVVAYASKSLGKHASALQLVGSFPTLQNSMTVLDITPVLSNAPAVACHDLLFPFSMFACHSLRNFTILKAYAGPSLQFRYLSCHGDTSIWSKDHPAFTSLHVPYGTPDICHQENEHVLFFF